MSNVIDLQNAKRLIWMCNNCGCSTFYLYSDSTSECAACNLVGDGGEWVTPLCDAPKCPEKTDEGSVSIKALGTIEFAKRHVLKKISDNKDDIAMVAAWFAGGGMTSWSGAETQEQQDWCVEKASDYAKHLEVRKIPEGNGG